MTIEFILPLLGGALLLWAGTEGLVRGGVAVARRLQVHPILIGIVLMGYGTSAAELLTGLEAMRLAAPDAAVGLVLGSNVFNILAVLGICALVAPLTIDRDLLRRDTWLTALVAVLGASVLMWGPVDRMDGALFLLLIAVYTLLAFLTNRESVEEKGHAPLWRSLALALAGAAAVVIGARLFAGSAVALAPTLGLSHALIGATLAAIVTSLPELTTSIVAVRRGQPGLAIGNVLGSNIFNMMAVLGASAMAAPIEPAREALVRDVPAMLLATAVVVALILGTRRIGRGAGAAMLALYVVYLLAMP